MSKFGEVDREIPISRRKKVSQIIAKAAIAIEQYSASAG